MNFIKRLKRRVRIVFRRDDVESDLSDEIRLHLDMEAEDLMRQGRTRENARREARLRLGGVEQTKEAVRDTRPLHWVDGIGLDTRLGLRMLRKSWGMTLIGGLAMAVAIGIGTTAFAVVDSYEGNTLPFDEGDRVVRLMALGRSGRFTSVQDFEWWRQEMQSVKDVSAAWTVERLLVTNDRSDGRVSVAQMTSSGFRVARVQPHLGRPLLEEDERTGAAPVVVIDYDTWQSRFAGDRAAVGQTVQLGGVDHVVVGIMPKGFRFPLNHQAWIPFRSNPLSGARPAGAEILVFGRLSPGVTVEKAQAEIAARGPARGDSPSNEETRTRVVPYAQSLARVPAWWAVVPWLVVLLLIPPGANIAILIYARNVSRQGEFAARYVLGAGRGRIVGQLLIEAFVLAAAAAGAGILMAVQLLGAIQRGVDQDPSLPFWVKPAISFETVLYVVALAAFAATVAGGVPALRATGRLRHSAFQGLGSRTSPRLGITWTALVVMQVALTTAVLPRFGEAIWMFLNPYLTGREFAAEQYVTARIVLEAERPSGAPAAAGTQLGKSRDLPAELVRRVHAGMRISGATVSAAIDGIDEKIGSMETDIAGQKPFTVGSNRVDKAYFDVFEASLLAGRAFEAADFNPERRVVIVDRMFAEQLAGQNPLGKRVRYVNTGKSGSETGSWYEIVGLVERISPSGQRPLIYHPILAGQDQRMSLTLRVGTVVPSDLARQLVKITTALDPNLQMDQIRTLDDVYRDERWDDNIFGLGFASILLVVLLFSSAGIYTLVAFAVAQRRKEIGIRSALGATPLRLVADVFRVDLAPVLAGVIVGALLAFPVDKLVPRNDGGSVSTFAVSAALMFMLTVGLFAVSGPARRALRIDATEALREN
jgi:predicted permease